MKSYLTLGLNLIFALGMILNAQICFAHFDLKCENDNYTLTYEKKLKVVWVYLKGSERKLARTVVEEIAPQVASLSNHFDFEIRLYRPKGISTENPPAEFSIKGFISGKLFGKQIKDETLSCQVDLE
jgi:hypothetical protein